MKNSIKRSAKSIAGAMLVAATVAAADVAIRRAREGAGGQTIPRSAKARVTKKTKAAKKAAKRPTKKSVKKAAPKKRPRRTARKKRR